MSERFNVLESKSNPQPIYPRNAVHLLLDPKRDDEVPQIFKVLVA